MHVHLFAKEITLDGVLALDVDQVFSPRVDIEVAVFSANGALAVHDFETFERGSLNLYLMAAQWQFASYQTSGVAEPAMVDPRTEGSETINMKSEYLLVVLISISQNQ